MSFVEDVKPILSDKCFSCHGPDKAKQKAGLRLDMEASAYGPLPESPGKFAIVPGNLNKSELYHRILSSDPDYMMPHPKSHLSLSAREKAILIKWIETGAVYKPHWAFVTPQKKAIPDIFNLQVNNPIDNFILSRLQREGLQPSPAASKELLLRRVSLDLTGLPPTIDEINSFVNDKSSNAYEKQVDRLLSSPHYGEKMATQWLDLARYADSYGYTVDRTRDMSVYRDWVIGAFNNNMSYKNFIHYQLAGDLMPSPTKEMIIATAFNRNHPQNMEGGIIEEEFQTIDPETRDLRSHMSKIVEGGKISLQERVKAEMHQAVVEVGTDICQDVDEAFMDVSALRKTISGIAESLGLWVGASGTHPFSHWQSQLITEHVRYNEIVNELQEAARSNLIFGLHVHVGMDNREMAIHIANSARYFLPHACHSSFCAIVIVH